MQEQRHQIIRQHPRETGPEHWVITIEPGKAKLYKKADGNISPIADADYYCAHVFPDATVPEGIFLANLANWLAAAEARAAFNRLVLVAPLEQFGRLYDLLPDDVRSCLCTLSESEIRQLADEMAEDRLTEVVWV